MSIIMSNLTAQDYNRLVVSSDGDKVGVFDYLQSWDSKKNLVMILYPTLSAVLIQSDPKTITFNSPIVNFNFSSPVVDIPLVEDQLIEEVLQ